MSVTKPAAQYSGGKLVFANQLRGLAAISVMLSHYGGVFVLMNSLVAWITSTPELHIGSPSILLLTRWNYLNLGSFGVAVFFLISGFVIPFSLRSQSSGSFLVARAFRIFPTFWAALCVEWLVVHTISVFTGRPMAYGPATYVQNAFLLDTITGSGFVDLVNWTLAIEVKFYIVAAVLRSAVQQGRLLPFFVLSPCAIVVAAMQSHGLLRLSSSLAVEPMYITYMFIGTIFYYHLTGSVRPTSAIVTMVALGAVFVCAWWLGPIGAQVKTVAPNYLYAFVVFGVCYLLRDMFRPVRVLDFLADVTFPFYLTHSIVGYSLMSILMHGTGASYAVALPTAVLSALLLATVLHRTIERPTIAMGRRVATSFRTVSRQ